ncbi:hypothetical protein D3C76_1683330 [compost metagenome]
MQAAAGEDLAQPFEYPEAALQALALQAGGQLCVIRQVDSGRCGKAAQHPAQGTRFNGEYLAAAGAFGLCGLGNGEG